MPRPLFADQTNNLISAKNWTAGRPDGQTATTPPDPAPPVKGTGKRPGLERIEARVPSHIGRKFKHLCAVNHLEQQDVLAELIQAWNNKMAGRLDGQPAGRPDHDLDDRGSQALIDDEENRFFQASSDQQEGRPDGQKDKKRREVLSYYALLTGNTLRQNDRDFLDTIIDLPTNVIKGGIAQSILRCATRINSLRYCLGAIEEIHETGVDQSFCAYLEAVMAREGKWNAALTPIDAAAVEAVLRKRARNEQPGLPGTSGDLLQLPERGEDL